MSEEKTDSHICTVLWLRKAGEREGKRESIYTAINQDGMSRIKSSPASSLPEIEKIALGSAVVPSPDKKKNPYKVGTVPTYRVPRNHSVVLKQFEEKDINNLVRLSL